MVAEMELGLGMAMLTSSLPTCVAFSIKTIALNSISCIDTLFSQLTRFHIMSGLDYAQSSLSMILSYVQHLPLGTEAGRWYSVYPPYSAYFVITTLKQYTPNAFSFLAIDLGGSNFRVLRAILDGSGGCQITKKTFKISEAHMTRCIILILAR